MAAFLSFCLGIFLADGVVSWLSDSLLLFGGFNFLVLPNGILTCISALLLLLIFVLTGITPLIPKRVFLPILLFNFLGLLAMFPFSIFYYDRILQLDWVMSLLQVALVLLICRRLLGGGGFRWSVVEARHLGSQMFSWWNLSAFLLVNAFVLVPAMVADLTLSAGVAVSHFTDGFLTLRPAGLILHARKYARPDGKTILLFPMSHVAETDFYQAVAHAVSSNSIVLLEGVTDENNLLTNHLSYKRAAKALGLAEQHEDLNIRQGKLVRADVDVQEFSSNTIAILNLVALVHSRGLNMDTLPLILGCSPTEEVERQLFADLLLKRNEHLLKELHARLANSDNFVIPWGAAHMPQLAKEIQKSGFRLVETRDYVSIRFGAKAKTTSRAGQVAGSGDSK